MTEDELQATYDRLVAYRARTIKYYDECPDGDPRKAQALDKLQELNERINEVESEFDQFDKEETKQAGWTPMSHPYHPDDLF